MIYDKMGNVVTDPDLNRGYLSTEIRIKSSTEPIDNRTKFAWADDDYETVIIYVPYTSEQLESISSPSPDEDRDAMLVDIEYRLTKLELEFKGR